MLPLNKSNFEKGSVIVKESFVFYINGNISVGPPTELPNKINGLFLVRRYFDAILHWSSSS